MHFPKKLIYCLEKPNSPTVFLDKVSIQIFELLNLTFLKKLNFTFCPFFQITEKIPKSEAKDYY